MKPVALITLLGISGLKVLQMKLQSSMDDRFCYKFDKMSGLYHIYAQTDRGLALMGTLDEESLTSLLIGELLEAVKEGEVWGVEV